MRHRLRPPGVAGQGSPMARRRSSEPEGVGVARSPPGEGKKNRPLGVERPVRGGQRWYGSSVTPCPSSPRPLGSGSECGERAGSGEGAGHGTSEPRSSRGARSREGMRAGSNSRPARIPMCCLFLPPRARRRQAARFLWPNPERSGKRAFIALSNNQIAYTALDIGRLISYFCNISTNFVTRTHSPGLADRGLDPAFCFCRAATPSIHGASHSL